MEKGRAECVVRKCVVRKRGVRHTFSYKWETYTVVEMWQICCWNDTRLYKEYVVAYTVLDILQ